MTGGFTLYGSPHSLFTYKVALMLRLSAAAYRRHRLPCRRFVRADGRRRSLRLA